MYELLLNSFDSYFLVYCFIGAVIGTIVGIFPTIGPSTASALLFPILLNININYAIILLMAILYGSQYGGSISSILFNIPGESSCSITAIEGYKFTRNNKANVALFICSLSSLIGGIISVIALIVCTSLYNTYAINLNSIHFFCIILISFIIIIVIEDGKINHNIQSACIGIFISCIGEQNGILRLIFDKPELSDGINFNILAISLFGFVEILYKYIDKSTSYSHEYEKTTIYLKDILPSIFPAIRGACIGLFSMIPGVGYNMVTILSYQVEKLISKDIHPHGNIKFVASPEAANNSATQSSFFPLFTLGIPTGNISSIILTIMLMNGIQVGSNFVDKYPTICYYIITSMIIINIMLFVLNYWCVDFFVKLLTINSKVLDIIILSSCVIICLYMHTTLYVYIFMIILICLGILMKKNNYNVNVLFMGYIYGNMIEEYGIRSFLIYR